MLKIKTREIRGRYPIYKVGDKIMIDDTTILPDKINALCTHALSTLIMSEDLEYTYMKCVNSGEPYIEDGTVIFECHKIQGEFDK